MAADGSRRPRALRRQGGGGPARDVDARTPWAFASPGRGTRNDSRRSRHGSCSRRPPRRRRRAGSPSRSTTRCRARKAGRHAPRTRRSCTGAGVLRGPHELHDLVRCPNSQSDSPDAARRARCAAVRIDGRRRDRRQDRSSRRPGAEHPARTPSGTVDQNPTLRDLGFDPQPAVTTWRLRLDANLTAADGQTLGYPWVGFVETVHAQPFVTFDGAVWEAGAGPGARARRATSRP